MRRFLILSAMMAIPAAALAHHSFSMFDLTRTATLSGTVQQFRWTNPHAAVLVTTQPGGEVWTLELTSPGNLSRFGWTRHSLAAGDQIKVAFAPLRDGTHGGSLRQVWLPSGASLSGSAPTK